jgi:hypothetical protein
MKRSRLRKDSSPVICLFLNALEEDDDMELVGLPEKKGQRQSA